MRKCFARQCDLRHDHADSLWTGNVPLPKGVNLHVSSQSRSQSFTLGILRGCRRRSASPPATHGPRRTEKETGLAPYAIRHRCHGTRRTFGLGATKGTPLQLPRTGAAIPRGEAAGAVVSERGNDCRTGARDVQSGGRMCLQASAWRADLVRSRSTYILLERDGEGYGGRRDVDRIDWSLAHVLVPRF